MYSLKAKCVQGLYPHFYIKDQKTIHSVLVLRNTVRFWIVFQNTFVSLGFAICIISSFLTMKKYISEILIQRKQFWADISNDNVIEIINKTFYNLFSKCIYSKLLFNNYNIFRYVFTTFSKLKKNVLNFFDCISLRILFCQYCFLRYFSFFR